MAIAKRAIQRHSALSQRATATVFDVPRTTLGYRIRGRKARIEMRASNRKLTTFEEQALLKWILSMAKRGYPPRICAVRSAAQLLLN
jgi:hypothetical protein